MTSHSALPISQTTALMKVPLLAMMSCLLTAFPAMAADGWQKVKWGMTEKQVRQAYPEARVDAVGGELIRVDVLQMHPYPLLGRDFTVAYGFDAAGKLSHLALSYPGKGNADVPLRKEFHQLQELLTVKYGKPVSSVTHFLAAEQQLWISGDTEIVLSHVAAEDGKSTGIEILYRHAPKWKPQPMDTDAEEMRKL